MNAPRWDMDALFEGGVHGDALRDALERVEARVERLVARADALPEPPEALDERVALLRGVFDAYDEAAPIRVVASGQADADTADAVAQRTDARLDALYARIERALVPVKDHVARCDDAHFAALCAHPEAAPLVPWMRHVRDARHLRLSRAEEALVAELGVDGIHAWSRHYHRVSGRLEVDVPGRGRMSVGRAKNLLSDADPAVRAAALRAVDAAWASVADDCAAALTHIVGVRHTLNRKRGVDPVDDSLARNRMERATLDAMLEAARRAGPLLERYLARKAEALGMERPGFADLRAPLGDDGAMSWDEATDFILTHFGSYHPDLRQLAERALRERWVEAEDRDHKRPGGYCASLPDGRSRIFMTYGGTRRGMTTLAHELGHAYHNHVLGGAHPSRRKVPSTLAESASVLAENLVRDAALAAAPDDAARLAMRDARLSAGVSFLMDIPFRYALERDLYTLRAAGELDPAALCEATVARQREHFRGALSDWFPHFWADKLHFYISHFAFYNYPYTFGYLFSGLLYARVKREGPGFHDRVVELLRRSGYERAEPLARDVLGIDLADPDAWVEGWAPLEEDLAAFEALVRGH